MTGTTADFMMAGLPGAGKSTFLAALWHSLESREAEGRLELATEPRDKHHLNALRTSWAAGEAVMRTPAATAEVVTLNLRFRGGNPFELTLPDVSGEAFRSMWSSRSSTDGLIQKAGQATGILFFIHATEYTPASGIDDADLLIEGVVPVSAQGGGAHSVVPPPFDPEEAPTDSKLVDILQTLRHLGRPRRPPVAVIISAWDLVTTASRPQEWLERCMPLLAQYLNSNREEFPFKAFGVSAQGGSLKDPKQVAELIEHSAHTSRIRVVSDGIKSHDLTLPLSWILGASKGNDGKT